MSRLHWWPAYVGVGSNLDSPADQVDRAIEALSKIRGSTLIAASPRYRSAPFGRVEQPDFINAVAAILTQLPPEALLEELQGIEDGRGRDRSIVKWGPRVIDLDLLVYGQVERDTPELRLPHPGIAKRSFVLFPLQDIAPYLHVPGLGTVATLAAAVADDGPKITRLG